jgi:hypothetical protein
VGVSLAVAGPAGALLGALAVPLAEAVILRERRVTLTSMHWARYSGISPSSIRPRSMRGPRTGKAGCSYCPPPLRPHSRPQVDSKIKALRRVVAEAVHDDARIDYAVIMVSALSELGAPHIRVLATMVRDIDSRPPTSLRVGERAWRASQLKEAMPELADTLLPIMMTLVRTAMVRDALPATEDNLSWAFTPFAEDCLNLPCRGGRNIVTL